MSNAKIWTHTMEDMDSLGNEVKETVLMGLLDAGAITNENYDYFLNNYAIVIKRKNTWGRVLEAIKLRKPNEIWEYYWMLVKIVNHE